MAVRESDDEGWVFVDQEHDLRIVTTDHTEIGNKALLAGAVMGEIDRRAPRTM